MRITTKAGVTNNTRERRKPRFDKQNDSLFLEASPQGMTQWPSEKQIRDVSKKLARINRMAIRAEADGDYFHSGDLAYQMHEIIRAYTATHDDRVVAFTSSWRDRAAPGTGERLGATVVDRRVPVRVLNFLWHRLQWPPVEALASSFDVVHAAHPLLIPSRGAARVVTVHDLYFLDLALALAAKGEGQVQPNPLVGAVVVKNGMIVGQGFHRYEGIKHAEVLALEEAGDLAKGATVYVNLEPCCHRGGGKRTPPCCDALIAAQVKRVVCCTADPNPRVKGKGFAALRAAGIAVTVGPQISAARLLNSEYIRSMIARNASPSQAAMELLF